MLKQLIHRLNRQSQRGLVMCLVTSFAMMPIANAETWRSDHLGPMHWTASWATASRTQVPSFDPPLIVINDTTLRQIVRISEGGQLVRVSFTNEFGTSPLNINAARIALRNNDGSINSSIDSKTDNALLFSGNTNVTIAPGARVTSDPVDMMVADQADLAISIHLPDNVTGSGSPVSYHVRALQTNYVASGDQTQVVDLTGAKKTTAWHFLASVDVANQWPMPVIAAIGDSLTDGDQMAAPHEPNDLNVRFTNLLSKGIIAANLQASVINLGISGNQASANFLGEHPLARMQRDVLTQAGVTHVILTIGINDIGLPVMLSTLGIPTPQISSDTIINQHRQLAVLAKAQGLVTIGGTLSPSGGSALPGYSGHVMETQRNAVNEWIRNSGTFDVVADFDTALRDPQDATKMRADLTADGLHPNTAGYQIMADLILSAMAGQLPAKRFEISDQKNQREPVNTDGP